jgi:Flp pilus assembly protein TadD
MDSTAKSASDALYNTARWLLDNGRVRDAADVFRALATCAPREERAWLGLGVCHEQMDQGEVALQMYAVGQAASAPAPRCAFAMALLMRQMGDENEFQELIQSAAIAAELRGDSHIIDLIEAEMKACQP